jgi:hypothetical protein
LASIKEALGLDDDSEAIRAAIMLATGHATQPAKE